MSNPKRISQPKDMPTHQPADFCSGALNLLEKQNAFSLLPVILENKLIKEP